MRITHIALDFSLRRERGNRVDYDKIDRTASYKAIGNIERLFARVGLRNIQIIEIYAEICGIGGIERVLGIDKRGNAAEFLRLRDYVQRNRSFTRRFGTVNLYYSSARNAACAERDIKRKTARGYNLDSHVLYVVAEFHDCAFAVLLFDLSQYLFQRFAFVIHFYILTIFFS